MDEATQPLTQEVMDPRRIGQTRSERDDQDEADMMAILLPRSQAAFDIVDYLIETRPEHVLFPDQSSESLADDSVDIEEQRTIILQRSIAASKDEVGAGACIALRMSSRLKNEDMGFVFGRNASTSDIVFRNDSGKRISNQHFRVYMNYNANVMIEDMSTNGTIIDTTLLKNRHPQYDRTRMLVTGSEIRIQHTVEKEVIRFVVRIPSRLNHPDRFTENVKRFLTKTARTDGDLKAIKNVGNHILGGSRLKTKWTDGTMYNCLMEIGKGAFGTVWKVATKIDGRLLAAKEIEKKKMFKDGKLDKKIETEVQILRGVQHAHIVEFEDVLNGADGIYIIMEFVQYGDLNQYMRGDHGGPPRTLDEEQAKALALQMLRALHYLHTVKRIAHRDIKPDNILMAEPFPDPVFKLADFGLSKNLLDQQTLMGTFCGTILYCAPEVFPDDIKHQNKRWRSGKPKTPKGYDVGADIYSLGAVIWHAITGKAPVEGVADSTGKAMFNNIMKTRLDTRELLAQGMSGECIDLLCGMLEKDHLKRPDVVACLNHPWFGDNTVPRPEPALGSIAEEVESDEGEEQLSQLNISRTDDVDDEVADDILEDEELLDMVDYRQSKRIRPDPRFPRNQYRDDQEASDEPSFQSEVLAGSGFRDSVVQVQSANTRPGRIFGEIGQSAFQSSGILQVHANQALSRTSSGNAFDPNSVVANSVRINANASPSLLGAEALVDAMNMDSPSSPASNAPTPNEPATPKTPDVPQHNSLDNENRNGSQLSEPTPKAKPMLNRQISLPRTPSFYYDPNQPDTHTLEHASKVSGIDFAGTSGTAKSLEASLPPTVQVSADDTRLAPETVTANGSMSSALPSGLDIKPPPRRLGKLTSTADSFNQLVLHLDKNRTSWGRLPTCDIVYEHAKDIRVPKTAFTIFWHSPDKESIEELSQEGKDWTSLKNVQVGIFTRATSGISINGKHLRKVDEKNRVLYGWLHTGDIIQVYQAPNGPETLKFKCEFYFGNGKEPRAAGKSFSVRIDAHKL